MDFKEVIKVKWDHMDGAPIQQKSDKKWNY